MSDEQSTQEDTRPNYEIIADNVLKTSLLQMVKEDAFPKGHSEVVVSIKAEVPGYTPKDFSPSNVLEAFMVENPKEASFKLTFPFAYEFIPFTKGIGKNKSTMSKDYDCEINVVLTNGEFAVEFFSKKLKRYAYATVSTLMEQ